MKIVVPGEKIKILNKEDLKNYKIINCFIKEKNKKFEVYSKFWGILNEKEREKIIEIIPINGKYLPAIGDFVIGKVKEVLPNMWIIDINSPFLATLLLKDALNERVDFEKTDLSKFYDINDLVFGKIEGITRNKTIRISLKSSSQKKLDNGLLVEINNILNYWLIQNKEKIREKLKKKKIEIIIGKNRLIWIKGKKEILSKLVKILKNMERTMNFDLSAFEKL
ncbi:MAG TPA: hypothetical protein EYH54_05550 [Nautiliaceae bacterium]|nr:hypothetical protein [Nautiliaceae bacterium]